MEDIDANEDFQFMLDERLYAAAMAEAGTEDDDAMAEAYDKNYWNGIADEIYYKLRYEWETGVTHGDE